MIEKALLIALVAIALIVGLSSIADAFKHNAKTVECAMSHATVCVHDNKGL
jgi:Flp pilus assembly pilin Flp